VETARRALPSDPAWDRRGVTLTAVRSLSGVLYQYIVTSPNLRSFSYLRSGLQRIILGWTLVRLEVFAQIAQCIQMVAPGSSRLSSAIRHSSAKRARKARAFTITVCLKPPTVSKSSSLVTK
jgi:hypothetical protein